MNHAKEPTPTFESMIDDPVYRVLPTTNVENLFTGGRQVASVAKELLSSLHLVCKSEARISSWVGESCTSLQHKFVSAEAKIKLAEVG